MKACLGPITTSSCACVLFACLRSRCSHQCNPAAHEAPAAAQRRSRAHNSTAGPRRRRHERPARHAVVENEANKQAKRDADAALEEKLSKMSAGRRNTSAASAPRRREQNKAAADEAVAPRSRRSSATRTRRTRSRRRRDGTRRSGTRRVVGWQEPAFYAAATGARRREDRAGFSEGRALRCGGVGVGAGTRGAAAGGGAQHTPPPCPPGGSGGDAACRASGEHRPEAALCGETDSRGPPSRRPRP